MQRLIQNFSLGAVMFCMGIWPTWGLSQETKPAAAAVATEKPATAAVEGELKLGDKTFTLSHIVAYEVKRDDDVRIYVLMSDRALPLKDLQTALAGDEQEAQSFQPDQPHLKIVFKKGKALTFNAITRGTTIAGNSKGLEGNLKLENGRVTGEAHVAPVGEDALRRSFDVKFDVALGVTASPRPARPAGPVKPTVTGTFTANGKPAKLAFVSAHPGEPFDDKPSIVLIFTEKDHSKEKDAENKALFGEFGSALIVSMHENGKIFSSQVAHSALEKSSISSNSLSSADFDLGDGQISGRLMTEGQQEFFGETWQVDIKFAAPFATPQSVAVAEDSPAKKSKKSKPKSADKPAADQPEDDKPAAPAGEKLNIYDLALPKDASDHKYVALTKHFEFTSKLDSLGLVGELTKSLAEQGWETEGRDLVTPKSSILRRKRGGASLTIFVKPAATGSKASMSAEGLDWTKKATKDGEESKGT